MAARVLIAILLLFGAPGAASAQGTNAAAVAGLEGKHPSEYFRRAADLFKAGKKDDAVYALFYGQVRYRTYLIAHPEMPKDGDPALFASLMQTIGTPINQYAFGDVPRLARSIDAVLARTGAVRDAVTPVEKYPAAHKLVRNGLVKLKQDILKNRDKVRSERAKNGLENRS